MFMPQWVDVMETLHPGEPIRYWGPHGGYSYGTFVITAISPDRLKFTTKQGVPLEFSKVDFSKTVPLLDEYLAGHLKSREVRNVTGRSVYIFSVIQELRDRKENPANTLGDLLQPTSRVFLKSEYGPVSHVWPAVSFSSQKYARQLGMDFDPDRDLIIFAGTQLEPTPDFQRGRLLCAIRVFGGEPVDSGLLVDPKTLLDFQKGHKNRYAFSLQLKKAWGFPNLPLARDYVGETYSKIGLGEARSSYLRLSNAEIERLRSLAVSNLPFAVSPLDELDIRETEEDDLARHLNRVLALLVGRAQSGGTSYERVAPIREVSLTKGDLQLIWKEQFGKCALCNRLIPLNTSNFLMQISADRIDSSLPCYDLRNTQLTHLGCNYGKNSATSSQFEEWIKMIRTS